MRLVSFDVETTMRCKRKGVMSATPWEPCNYIVFAGVYDGEETRTHAYVHDLPFLFAGDKIVLCGHNIKFDLHHTRRELTRFESEEDAKKFWAQLIAHPLWDTMVADYILSGQARKFQTLEQLREMWAPEMPPKGNLIEKLIEAGADTSTADMGELAAYLASDLAITWTVAQRQINEAAERGMTKVIFTQCAALKAIQQMEDTGIRFDLARCAQMKRDTEAGIHSLVNDTADLVWGRMALHHLHEGFATEDFKFDGVLGPCFTEVIGSNHFWSSYLFGGKHTFEWRKPDGEWKSGKKKGTPRFSRCLKEVAFEGIEEPSACGSKRGKDGYWQVDSKVLNRIVPALTEEVTHLLLYRKKVKLLTTYLEAIPPKLWEGDRIHHTIHQVSTDTGRYSSSNPNLQNVAGGEDDVKRLLVPDEGRAFIEADYKQLEVVALAHLCRDAQLVTDLKARVDIHGVLAHKVFGKGFSKDERRIIKGINFGTIYGGGAERLAQESGLKKELVESIQRAFYKRYPTIKAYRKRLEAELVEGLVLFGTPGGVASGHRAMISETGRVYNIPYTLKPVESGMQVKMAFTRMCNYPVQGWATGDLVPMMLAHMEKWIRENCTHGLVRMLNTVHDSILFDCEAPQAATVARDIKLQLEGAGDVYKRVFGHELDIPLEVEVAYSHESWGGEWTVIK